MELRARDRVPELTGLLTVVALALVFGAVLGVIPRAALPQAPEWFLAAIPHVNAVVSLVAIAAIVVGWRAIRSGQVTRHRNAMLTTLVLFAIFLLLYLYRVSLEGPTDFPGPAAVEQFVYFPILGIHILLAIVCIPLLFYVLLLALTRSPAELSGSNHPRVGRVAATLWLVSFALGTVVYLLLYVLF
jgi:putative membrane protein